jgi:hypothetical protein
LNHNKQKNSIYSTHKKTRKTYDFNRANVVQDNEALIEYDQDISGNKRYQKRPVKSDSGVLDAPADRQKFHAQ